VDQPPVSNGYVTVVQNSIVEIGQRNAKNHSVESADSVIDLGEVAIIPALVNAHTHLEFSYLRQPLGWPGIEFTAWIRQVVTARSEQNQSHSTDSKAKSILRGLAESYRSGVGCIGEIATDPVSANDYHCPRGRSEIDQVVFYEQLGRNPNLFAQRQIELNQFLCAFSGPQSRFDSVDRNLLPGISPHAPYSVHPDLLKQMIEVAIKTRLPVGMHLAETEAERELLSNQTGPFVELLKDFGSWNSSSFLPRQSITGILEMLGRCERALLVHGNYLQADEIQLIGSLSNRMTVVYCPRTHEYFHHSTYPLEQLQRAGALVALGTDSRASNPDLNLFSELQTVARKFPNQSPLTILEMGTLNGAKGLGKAARLGSLSAGKLARMNVLEHPGNNTMDLDWLLDAQTRCRPIME
jgi:cytosine/adenosine deaminase-related metal-dependent hydrolase